jgi:hypothetical protein
MISIALLVLLPLVISFTINHWLVIADKVPSSWWKDGKMWETQWIRREI